MPASWRSTSPARRLKPLPGRSRPPTAPSPISREFASLREENARLREENSRLLAWQTAARRLENENDRLRDLSQFREGPEASFITSRIVGDSVSAYVRGALLNVGRRAGVTSGQAVVTGEGLAGRVAEVGENSARVLFVTDVNSRLPVQVERTRERAILVGDNSPQLRLNLLQGVAGVQRGDRIVTSGDGGSFPVGIPIGEVVQSSEGHIRVRPFADFARLEFVRVVNYGVTGLVTTGPVAPGGALGGQAPGAPAGQTPGAPAGQTPGAPAGQTPGAPAGQTPGAPAGQRVRRDEDRQVRAAK